MPSTIPVPFSSQDFASPFRFPGNTHRQTYLQSYSCFHLIYIKDILFQTIILYISWFLCVSFDPIGFHDQNIFSSRFKFSFTKYELCNASSVVSHTKGDVHTRIFHETTYIASSFLLIQLRFSFISHSRSLFSEHQ